MLRELWISTKSDKCCYCVISVHIVIKLVTLRENMNGSSTIFCPMPYSGPEFSAQFISCLNNQIELVLKLRLFSRNFWSFIYDYYSVMFAKICSDKAQSRSPEQGDQFKWYKWSCKMNLGNTFHCLIKSLRECELKAVAITVYCSSVSL